MVTGVFAGAAVGFVYLAAILFSDSGLGRDRRRRRNEGSSPQQRRGHGKG